MTASDAEWQARIAALRAHPSFLQSARGTAARLASLYQGGPLLNWLMDDRGRMVFSHLALYCHFSRDPADASSGLTPTRMKELCRELGICSPGRVTAMLSLMRFAGYLAPDPTETDGRRRRLVATPRLVELLRERLRANFSGAAELFKDGERLIARFDEPAFMPAFTFAMCTRFRAGFRLLAQTPALELFGDRNAGMMILATLMAAGDEDDTVPPSRPVSILITDLARRFRVSRVHVSNLLRAAADAGLIVRTGDKGEQVAATPALVEAVGLFFANAFLFFFDCAREADASAEPATDQRANGALASPIA